MVFNFGHNLGGHVRRSATKHLQRVLARDGKPKVDNFYQSRLSLINYVLRFQVSVTNLLRVHVGKSMQQL